jgi:hypothetical protein
VAAEIVGPATTAPGTTASNTLVPYGVRVLAGRIDTVEGGNEELFSGLAEWDFIDGQLNFSSAQQSMDINIGAVGAVPITTKFQYQTPSNQLHSIQGMTDLAVLPPNQTSMNLFLRYPFVTKGSVAITADNSVSASSKAILTRDDITTTADQVTSIEKQYLLYHKFIHPMMAASVGAIAAGDTMPLSPLYSFLSNLSNVPTPFPTLQIAAAAITKSTTIATTSTVKSSAPTPGSAASKGLANANVPLVSDLDEAFSGTLDPITKAESFNERGTPFSIYNWEIGLHAPMILIDRLLKSQQFDQALNVCHYVFNPMVQGNQKDMTRFWIFAPFRQVQTQTTEQMFMQYVANTFRYATFIPQAPFPFLWI